MSHELSHYGQMELAAALPGDGFERNHWVCADDHQAVSQWRARHSNTDVYATVCRFASQDRASQYRCPFFADIDCKDLEQARQDTLKACDLLIEHLGLSPGCLDIHFSGAKGFHVVVPLGVFGNPDYDHLLQVWKALARRLAQEGVRHIDQGVYDRARVLRLPNSIHSKTGLYKVPLEYKELRDLGLGHVLEVARQPREEDSMAVPEECPRAVGWFKRAIAWDEKRRKQRAKRKDEKTPFRQGWRMPPCIQTLERVRLPDGLRHSAYFVLARWYAYVNMHPQEAEKRLGQIDRRHPIRDPHYIHRVVKNGRERAGFAGCEHEVLCLYCQPDGCFLRHLDRRQVQTATGEPDAPSQSARTREKLTQEGRQKEKP